MPVRLKHVSGPDTLYLWRFWVLVTLLGFGLLGLIWRMFDLTVIDRDFLQQQGNARTLRTERIMAYRGMITDRHGEPLAVSTPVDSIWVNPKSFKPNQSQLRLLAARVGLTPHQITKRVKENSAREFLYLKRHLNPYVVEQIVAAHIPGVHQQREYRRYYPEGEVVAQVLGFTNIDDEGQEGVELAFNDSLHGVPGKKRVIKDRMGNTIAEIKRIQEPRSGGNLTLSIDRRIQYIAYRELKMGISRYLAEGGSIVVLDVPTGEVLAMANQPSFNPNNRPNVHDGRFRNQAVTDGFEPGSTSKTFSVASALGSGQYHPDTIVDTEPGWIVVSGKKIKDLHDNGKLTLTSVLKRSSNVGISRVMLTLPPSGLVKQLQAMGFGKRTGIEFPGENGGSVPKAESLSRLGVATLGFGYGLSVTALQLANAYAIIANGGVERKVTLLHNEHSEALADGPRVLSAVVANQLQFMLEAVVEKGGTAVRAQIPGFRVSGKTGTVRMVGPEGYEEDKHVALFAGMAPSSRPRLVIVVVIKNPRSLQFLGGEIAAPVFANVMADSLRALNVPPDHLTPDTNPA